MHAQELFSCLDEYLQIEAVADYGTQGLQVDAQNDKVDPLHWLWIQHQIRSLLLPHGEPI